MEEKVSSCHNFLHNRTNALQARAPARKDDAPSKIAYSSAR